MTRQTNTPADLPADPVDRARLVAIRVAGGSSKVAREINRSRGYVDKMYAGGTMEAKEARVLARMTDGVVTLRELLPDVYGGLTTKELGYTPSGE